MDRGYIKLWRKLRDSWVAFDPRALSVFFHILMRCEWERGQTRMVSGEEVALQPGQMTCGRFDLMRWTGLSEQEVRTAKKKLKNAAIITIKATNRFSLITVLNWDTYQNTNQLPNQPLTNNQLTPNQQVTTLEESKNLRIKEEDKTPPCLEENTKAKDIWNTAFKSKKNCSYVFTGKDEKKLRGLLKGVGLEELVWKIKAYFSEEFCDDKLFQKTGYHISHFKTVFNGLKKPFKPVETAPDMRQPQHEVPDGGIANAFDEAVNTLKREAS